jgi:serine/threonine-protein kinase HipA
MGGKMTEQLAVYFDRKRLGSLSIDGKNDNYSLAYDPEWLAESGFAISPHLPPGESKSGSVKRFLANLLPEGKWLEELAVDRRISKNNIFGLLAAIGVETTGALTFRQDGAGNEEIPTSFRPVSREELQDRLAKRQQLSIANWDGTPRLSVAGVQDKLPVLLRPDGEMGFGEGGLASTHILKFGTKPEMHLVVNEFICMALARRTKLPVAPVALARFGEPVLIVERFDRRWFAGQVARLHVIDGCQMLDLPPTYKYERPFGKSGESAKLRTGANLPDLFAACKLCRIPALAIRDLLNWVLFQLLIGNGDAHGKNISFYVDRAGIDLAPAYDLVNIEVYGDQYDRDLAMAVGDTFALNEIFAYQLAEMCDECGLPPRQVATALKNLCTSLSKAVDNFDLSQQLVGDEPAFGERMLDKIKANCQRFLGVASELPAVQL